MKRRSLILGGLAGAPGPGWLLRPREVGSDHAPYFSELSAALDQAGLAKPTLVVDRSLLVANGHTLAAHIRDRFHYRIVAKPLPSLDLLATVMFVFLQLGDIAVYDEGVISQRWPVFGEEVV